MTQKSFLGIGFLSASCILIGFFLLNLNIYPVLRILTGNYLIDTLLELIVTGPVLIPLLWLVNLFIKPGKEGLTSLLISLAITYFILTISYLFSQLTVPLLPFLYDEPFQYIRASVGSASLTTLFSLMAYFKVQSVQSRLWLLVSVLLPVLSLPIIALSLEHNNISWSHLED